MTNKVNSTSLTFTAVEGADDFMLDVQWSPTLAEALEAVGGDENKLPPSHKMMLLIVGKVLSPAIAFNRSETTDKPAAVSELH
jgi:hypothetical protein